VRLRERMSLSTLLRFDPNSLRKEGPQILANAPIRFSDETGTGLASVLQAINSRDVDAFVNVRDQVRKLFPTVATVLVPSVARGRVTLQARLEDGTVVPASAMSEGLLYFLAFASLRYLEGSRLFLVEEPENGLHPARIHEVMRILREISKEAQVLIATHSPLVVNELTGDEVSVVTRTADAGTQVTLLKDVPGYEDAMKIYQPGEFWLNYCDGITEEPLRTGSARK